MTEPSLALRADQIAGIVRDFIRLKPRLKVVLPEDIAQLKERLGELHPEDGVGRAADYDLFYCVGIVLSRQGQPLSMGDLSEALAVPLSTATRMVDWLVESGYADGIFNDPSRRWLPRPPAMAGLADHIWTVKGLLTTLSIPPPATVKGRPPYFCSGFIHV
jgi:hypothetical protein